MIGRGGCQHTGCWTCSPDAESWAGGGWELSPPAADITDIVEVTAHKLLTCRMLGLTPPFLPEEAVSAIRKMGNLLA